MKYNYVIGNIIIITYYGDLGSHMINSIADMHCLSNAESTQSVKSSSYLLMACYLFSMQTSIGGTVRTDFSLELNFDGTKVVSHGSSCVFSKF